MHICLSPGGPSLYRTDAPADTIMVGTTDGMTVLSRLGRDGDWQVSRRALEGRHVDALLSEPTSGTIFAGTYGDSIYASTDDGRTWQRRSEGVELVNIYSLNAAQTGDGVRIYAGTEPAHIYVSADLGETWRELPSLRALPGVDEWTFPAPPHVAHLKGFAVDPLSPSTVYAGVEVGGLFKSVDGGENWRELKGFDAAWDGDFHRLAIRAGQSDDLYLSGGSGVWHSGDAGEHWEHLTDREMRIGYPDGLIVHPDQQNLVFIAGAAGNPGSWRRNGTADAGIGRSRDGGRTWDILSRGLPDHIQGNIEAMSMNLWAGGFSLFATGIDGDVFASDDEGDAWTIIARGLPPVSKGTAGRSRRAAATT